VISGKVRGSGSGPTFRKPRKVGPPTMDSMVILPGDIIRAEMWATRSPLEGCWQWPTDL
jgi:hypothetical protein